MNHEEVAQLHIPVLKDAVIQALAPKNGGRYLDGTLGMGGHAEAILATAAESRLCGLDRDGEALEMAKIRLSAYSRRTRFFQMSFGEFPRALKELDWQEIDGALLDLGLSSMQLDDAQRGFSFLADARLDMRMDRESGQKSAWDIVNGCSYAELHECIACYGEEPLAARIAREIVQAREHGAINTTTNLAEIVCRAYPQAWRKKAKKHPATRTFQALRMAVNNELQELREFLDKIMAWLAIGGRLAIISFHSLEDRIVKRSMRKWAAKDNRTLENGTPQVARILYNKPLVADRAELALNPRSSSAKLRAVEKIA